MKQLTNNGPANDRLSQRLSELPARHMPAALQEEIIRNATAAVLRRRRRNNVLTAAAVIAGSAAMLYLVGSILSLRGINLHAVIGEAAGTILTLAEASAATCVPFVPITLCTATLAALYILLDNLMARKREEV